MRICINAAAANQGGAVTHLANLLPHLAELDSDDAVEVFEGLDEEVQRRILPALPRAYRAV